MFLEHLFARVFLATRPAIDISHIRFEKQYQEDKGLMGGNGFGGYMFGGNFGVEGVHFIDDNA